MTGTLTLGTDGRATDREGEFRDNEVKANRLKFYQASKKTTGLEAADD